MADIKKINVSGTEYDIDALKLNGHLATDIFESNGTTAKNATTADKLNSNVVNVTIPTDNWEESGDYPERIVSVTGVTANNNIIVSPSSSITADQLAAWGTAQIMATGQGSNYIVFSALSGTAPSVVIPVTVLILN